MQVDEARRNAEAMQGLATRRAHPPAAVWGCRGRTGWTSTRTDPIATMRRASRRVLLMRGGRDYNARPEDLARWEEGLPGVPDVTATRPAPPTCSSRTAFASPTQWWRISERGSWSTDGPSE